MSLLGECNFEARHIMCVSRHKSESSIQSYSRSLSEVNQKQNSHAPTSACSVENFKSTSTKIIVMHQQTSENFLGRNRAPNSSDTMQNFAPHSQETVDFHANAISGPKVTINF